MKLTHTNTEHNNQQHSRIIAMQLLTFVQPYVETGFDAQQIQQELAYQGIHHITDAEIQAAISITLGEMA